MARWEPEAALVARPELDVEVHLLPPGGFPFLTALSQGASIARAAAIAAAETPSFDPVANLTLLVDARIGVKLVAPHLLRQLFAAKRPSTPFRTVGAAPKPAIQ